MPRTDEETDQGLVSDVCIKRKVRNYIHLLKGLKTPYDIFIREGNILNPLIQEKRDEADKTNNEEKKAVKSGRQAMCAQYFDIRTFGAVMSTGEEKAEEEDTEEKGKKKKANSKKKIKGLGVVRGPVQFTLLVLLILFSQNQIHLLVVVLQRRVMRVRIILLVINIL